MFWNSSIFRGHPRRDNDASRSPLQKLRRPKHKEFGRSSTRQKRQLARSLLRLAVKAAGYGSLYGFLDDLVTTKDQNHSSQVSQMLISHGDKLLDSIRSRQPEVVSQWISKVAGNILAEEGAKLAQHLRPPHGQSVTTTIENFALSKILADAEFIAPTLCHFLPLLAKADPSETHAEGRKDKNLVLATVLCILAQTTNEKASEYQTTMGIYLLACGASRSQFDVLNHAGICLSYRSVLRKIKALGEERLEEMRHIVKCHMFMIIWDNLNFAFRVGQQRLGSNDHFDNGTTATVVVLWGFSPGDLPLDVLPPRRSRLPVLEFSSQIDLLPTLEDVQNLEALQRYHIKEILLDAYPVLRTRFRDSISGPPSILSIPVHTTSPYPAPAMPIDESSLDGTIDVFSTIFRNTLKLTGQDIERHGVVAASRRDDVDLLDNLSRYGKEQLGIFHAKPMTAGWKAKKLPPFRPSYELMIDLALPANILDGFRLFCAKGTVEKWIESVKDWDSVRFVAAKVHRELCSARNIPKLRRQPAGKRDPIYENIKLFNRDALTLLVLRAAIKRGDIGAVLCVISHWMVMFRGTGRMPKYADAVFRVITELKSMHPKLREAYLMNWLANLTGKLLGFKEMDLLQEHQNFWLKIIYNANGSNRTWAWLGMISVSIFALRDVIPLGATIDACKGRMRQMHVVYTSNKAPKVQLDYKIPSNGKSHTNPSTATDVQRIRDHLETNKIQTFWPERENNDCAVPVRDLMEAGAAYANTARAFKTFRADTRKASNLGTKHAGTAASAESDGVEEEGVNFDNYGKHSQRWTT
ncbi:hypothetical protein B0H14DRAFT_3760274 [Mycena olivaceomarginata]|nr:hypothetical protein B0H14DRAFT_3760274 [Mycena olivaceomarginata]